MVLRSTRARFIENLTSPEVYVIGKLIQSLRELAPTVQMLDANGRKSQIYDNLSRLEQLLGRYGLAESERANFANLQSEFSRTYNHENRSLAHQDYQRLTTSIERIESSLSLELELREFSEIKSAGGTLDYAKLISEGPVVLMTPGVFQEIPVMVQQDLREAVTSLSYGAPTASAMISLRAVEGMLRQFYAQLVGGEFTRSWGQLIQEIGPLVKDQGGDAGPLLGYLDYLRTIRNQADHPDRSFSDLEGERILNHAIYTIEEIFSLKESLQSK